MSKNKFNTRTEVQEYVLDKLIENFEEAGFKVHKGRKTLRRKNPSGFDEMECSVVDYDGEYTIEFSIAIRKNEVDDIYNQFSDSNPKSFKHTRTFLAVQYRLEGVDKEEREFYIKKRKNVDDALENFFEFMSTHGMAYYEKYADLKKMDEAINSDPEAPQIHIFDEMERARRGLILAKLTDNPNFEDLVDTYRKTLDGWTQIYIEEFEALIKHLKTL